MSLEEENKALVRRWNEEIWKGNRAIFSEVLARNCIFHWLGGTQEIEETVDRIRSAFPDATITIEDQIAEADKVVTRWKLTGTHLGELWRTAPTGRRVAYTGITINRVADGKIMDDWCEVDLLCVMRQIGAIPSIGTQD